MGELAAFGIRNKRTQTGTEILFCLAASYEFESRAVLRLEQPSTPPVSSWTAPPSPQRFSIRAPRLSWCGKSIRSSLRTSSGWVSTAWTRFWRPDDREQGKIYEFIAAGAPEARNRAFFALGSLHWAAARGEAAIEKWRAVGPEFAPVVMGSNPPSSLCGGDLGVLTDPDRQGPASPGFGGSSELLARLKKFHKWAVRSEGLERSVRSAKN